MQTDAVTRSYRRWAPIYDATFGAVTEVGRRRAAGWVSEWGGEVLEVGVGTGLALRHYRPGVAVTGIDFSEEMLARARAKVAAEGLTQVRELRQMDARQLDFADDRFDHVVAMHVLSVVPEPERVVAEMARVVRPGGFVLIVNHFASGAGFLGWLERRTSGLENLLGWHSDFDRARVSGDPRLELVVDERLPPLGMMSFLVFRKAE